MTSQDARTNVANLFNNGMAALTTMEQIPALQKMFEASADYDSRKDNHLARIGGKSTDRVKLKNGKYSDVGSIQFADDGALNFTLRYAEKQYRLNSNAWGQICGRLGESLFGKGSLHKLTFMVGTEHKSAAIRAGAAALLNAIIAEANPNVLLLRTYEDTVRAALTHSYADVGNTEMIKYLGESLAFQQRKFNLQPSDVGVARTSKVTPDSLYLTVVTKGIDPKDDLLPSDKLWEGRGGTPGGLPYGLGVLISNDETGNGRIKVSPVIKRTSCDNSIVIGHEDTLSLVHRGQRSYLASSVTNAIGSALRIGVEYLGKLMGVREVEIDNFYAAIDHLAEAHDWSTDQRDLVLKGSEGQRNVYGLVNGVSYVPAHSDSSLEAQAQFEALAGGLLHNPAKYFPAREFAWVQNVPVSGKGQQ